MLRTIGYLVILLVPTVLVAQSPQSATGGEGSIRAGGEYSSFSADYTCTTAPCNSRLMGPTVFFDINPTAKWGVEGEARWLHWNGTGGEKESNYLAGLRYRALHYHRLAVWAKFLAGGGWITTPYYPQAGSLQGSYFAYVPGATAEYPITRKIAVRADYEYQIWPSFTGPPEFTATGSVVQQNGLHPNGFSVGISYKILGP